MCVTIKVLQRDKPSFPAADNMTPTNPSSSEYHATNPFSEQQ